MYYIGIVTLLKEKKMQVLLRSKIEEDCTQGRLAGLIATHTIYLCSFSCCH